MKKYNVKNYIRYKLDLTDSINNIELKELKEYTREELIVMFLPLVENIGRKFATSQQASGVMSINDLIQEGRIFISIIPDIESVNYGRGVGYNVIEHCPPEDINEISATSIRAKMKNDGKL